MANGKPPCGSLGEKSSDILAVLLVILGAAGTALGIAAKFVPAFQAALAGTASPFTILGVSAVPVVWMTAAAAAGVTLVVIASFYYNRCLSNPDGPPGCSSGVVESATEAFDSVANDVFPFTANHNRLDVVVKSMYWALVQLNAFFIYCGSHPDAPPLFRCYYYTKSVCAAGLGSVIGGVAGAVGGILLGALAAAAIGCATIILCIFALLLGAIIAAAVVLAGAYIGGTAGRVLADDTDPTSSAGEAIELGHYVTTKGKLIVSGDDEGARVYWFVDDTSLHGKSTGSPPFSYTDPDMNLPVDACPAPIDPIV